ncbi:MAG: insulinase family protein, partial [Flavobacterium sp.]|nr:insulinase family protein [Pedobacter sp.]
MSKENKILVCVITLVISISGLTNAQTAKQNKKAAKKATPISQKSEVLPMDANVRIGKLANGFTYYIRKNLEPKDRAQLYLANKIGSIVENDDQQGLAHFVEHMSFNGTKNFPKNELVSYLQKAGVRFGADLNAYTSFDETVYQLPIPTDDPELFKNGLQIMRDWAQDATLDLTEINKERGVVLEEKRLGKGAQQRMQDKYLPMLFNNSRYSNRLPIGTEEVLKNFKPETIRQFYTDWYRPDLQALIVVGDIDVNQVEQMIKTQFSTLKLPAKPRPRIQYNIPLLNKNQFSVVYDKEFPVTVAQILIKHPEVVVKNTSDLRNNMIRSLYNQMTSARFSELTKQADPPFLQGGASIGGFLAGLDAATTFVVAKPGELEKGFKTVLTETERIKRFGFAQTELDRAKTAFMTSQESAFKEMDKTTSESFVNEYLQHFLTGEASPGIQYEYEFYKNNITGVSLAEINDIAKKYLTDVNRDVIIMGPEKDKDALPNETTVNNWIKSVTADDITAYNDQVSDKPLLAIKPAAGKVISEKKISELNITELTFNNGVKVMLKPTDFKNDEISFSGVSPGGTSLYSDAGYQAAANASSIIKRSGVGGINSIQLSKLLTGKKVIVQPGISERSESIIGFTNPQDLETALQMVYL